MEPSAWAALAIVFALGAMSPGPSLAVVLRNTMTGGRSQGIYTGIGHGIGFGIYAFLAALGIATALSANEHVEQVLRWGGVVILLWLGTTFLRHAMAERGDEQDQAEQHAPSDRIGFIQGFSIALLNPKIMAWMLALYSPFIEADFPMETLIGMGLLGMSIDGAWYVTVATVLTTGDRAERLKSNAHLIDGAMGVLMFLFAYILVSGF
ncbi:MAG: LysE family translocator [Candidatus Thalassarchaeum sp.]|jgi:threonine/homoserine/homoserine lactone efflux protein|nr:LysE family translocator [Candidatus Thalassarchaeum sp.]|tara:strand:- start:583 stop:1206 length:624 start_codon:yes stop_codon:yes gene_type:complete